MHNHKIVHFTCCKCDGELTYKQRTQSDGVCPHCNWASSGTIVMCNERGKRWVDGKGLQRGYWDIDEEYSVKRLDKSTT